MCFVQEVAGPQPRGQAGMDPAFGEFVGAETTALVFWRLRELRSSAGSPLQGFYLQFRSASSPAVLNIWPDRAEINHRSVLTPSARASVAFPRGCVE